MKKVLLIAATALLSSWTAMAQTVQHETFEFEKQIVTGYTISIVGKSVELVEGAMKDRLEKYSGLRPGKKVKGFQSYPNQQLARLGTVYLSIYTKVVEEGKKNGKVTRVYFLICSDNGTPIAPETHPSIDRSAMQYLGEFNGYLIDYENNQLLIQSSGLAEKYRKELETLKNDKVKLEKEIQRLHGKVGDKEKEIKAKEEAIRQAEADVLKYQELLMK
ncbi:MAG: hypothetical protein LBS16_06540 [Prevotellaceae bacterium]|jgi:peptidoglycan hydrolase CwlO-like protein|nr:hypothetical protein [Prevotellaceae bacterium]